MYRSRLLAFQFVCYTDFHSEGSESCERDTNGTCQNNSCPPHHHPIQFYDSLTKQLRINNDHFNYSALTKLIHEYQHSNATTLNLQETVLPNSRKLPPIKHLHVQITSASTFSIILSSEDRCQIEVTDLIQDQAQLVGMEMVMAEEMTTDHLYLQVLTSINKATTDNLLLL